MPGGDRAAALQAGNSWPRQARSVDHPRRHRNAFPCHRHVVADQQDVVSRPFGRISVFSLLSSNLLLRPVELGPVDPHAMQNDRELTSDRYLSLAKPVALDESPPNFTADHFGTWVSRIPAASNR